MNSASTGERVCRVAAAALIGAVLILVINAPRNDGKLKARIESLKLSEELQPGEMLPPIEVPIVFPQPGSVRIPQPDTDVLVMFYSGECPLCRDAWRTWNTIADTRRSCETCRCSRFQCSMRNPLRRIWHDVRAGPQWACSCTRQRLGI